MKRNSFWRIVFAMLLAWGAFLATLAPTPTLAQTTSCDAKYQGHLIGYWGFDGYEPLKPVYGGVEGTMVGTLYASAVGIVDAALDFDGHSYVNLGTSINVPAWPQYTVSIWFRNNGSSPPANGYGQKIIDKTTWFSDFYLSVNTYASPPRPVIYNYAENFRGIRDDSHDYQDSQWHHALIVKDNTHAELWVDGAFKGSKDDAKLVINNQPLLLGYSLSPDGYQRLYWGGSLDELAIFDRALTTDEILELYATTSSGKPTCTVGDDGGGGEIVDVRNPQLVAALPPTNGIRIERIEAIKGLNTKSNELILSARNEGANCGRGPAPTIWKAYFDPASKELIRIERKADLSAIQIVRNTLFEARSGTLFTASGICGYLPAYYSTDRGESWLRADSGPVHPPNSTMGYGEFQGNVYLGTGYEPYNGEIYRWLGDGNWERVFDWGPVRNIAGAFAEFQGELFAGAINYGYTGRNCTGSVAVYRTNDGETFVPTSGIPDCYGVTKLMVVEHQGTDELVAVTLDADISDTYFYYRWNPSTATWERVEQLMYMKYGQPTVVRMHLLSYNGAIYSFGRPLGEVEQGLYMTTDLGRTWQQVKGWSAPPVFALDFYDDYLYLGTARDSSDNALLYRFPVDHLPVRMNEQLNLLSITKDFDPTPVAGALAGTFTINATFENTLGHPIQEPYFRVTALSGGNLLLSATSGQRAEGATQRAPAVISAGERFEMSFAIGLQAARAFDFYVDAYGVVPGAINSAIRQNELHALPLDLSVADGALEDGASHEIYMPVISR